MSGVESEDHQYNVVLRPLYLIRAGAVRVSAGAWSYVGHDAFSWSNTTVVPQLTNSFAFHINPSVATPYSYENQYGFSVRCVAR